MSSGPRRTLGAISALVSAISCRPATAPVSAASAGASAAEMPRVELRTLDDRPALGLVQRDGDPKGAVALAIAHDFGSEASVSLSALLVSRLGKAGFREVRARAHGLGLSVATLATPAEATRFVQAASAALASPVGAGERLGERTRVPTLRSAAEAAVHACSGELGIAANPSPGPADANALERWRGRLRSARAASFAAVGARPLLDAVVAAVAAGDKWSNDPGPTDPWPDADAVGSASSAERRLSIAYRVADPARALEVANALGTPGSTLSERLGSLEGTFLVERVVATTRVRGACLRVDVRAPAAAPAASQLARAVVVVDDEARRELDAAKGAAASLDEAVLRPAHPAEAAGAAAWRALIGRERSGSTRRAVSWQGVTQGEDFARAVATHEAARGRAALERRVRLEAGQGELWALVASPCGTAAESSDDAGIHDVVLRALSAKGSAGVGLEPWITPDAVGVLAHSPRATAHESADEHARRVGEALGRALATPLTGSDVAEAKSDLLQEIGPAGQRGYFVALDATSGGHPSWLDPRGTWRSVSGSPTESADARRRLWLSGPLRLAVLANVKGEQAESLGASLERWLRPLRGEPSACPSGTRSAINGEQTVEVASAEHARALVAYPIAASARSEAEWTAFLANRPGGWLEQALRGVGESRARAAVLGGRLSAALLIEIQCPEAERAAALGQVRALVQRLAKGDASEADTELARRHFETRDAERALDPRGRIVELWRGGHSPRAELGSLRRFHQSLGTTKEIVVHAKPKA